MCILIDIDNFFNNDVIISLLVTNSTGNSKLGQDCRRVHSRRNATSLLANLFRLVETVAN